MKAKAKIAVTEEEIQNAIKKFIRGGGLIKQLPNQITPRNTLVGTRWGAYEMVSGTASSHTDTSM